MCQVETGYDPAVLPLESFIDPGSNEKVELNGGFSFVWANHNDEYILSNDASFNPSVTFNENWTQLKRMNPASLEHLLMLEKLFGDGRSRF
jgi:hypothetical protein